MSKTSFHYTALLVDIGNVNKGVCSYISRDIRSDQLEHTLLKDPIPIIFTTFDQSKAFYALKLEISRVFLA